MNNYGSGGINMKLFKNLIIIFVLCFIFVINVNGYIGESTKSEIEYAISTGKKVNYLEENI